MKLISIVPPTWKKSHFSDRWQDWHQPDDEVELIQTDDALLFMELDPALTAGMIYYNPSAQWWLGLNSGRKIAVNIDEDVHPAGWTKDKVFNLAKKVTRPPSEGKFIIRQDDPVGWQALVKDDFDCFAGTLRLFEKCIQQKQFYCERQNGKISDLIIWNILQGRYVGYFWWSENKLGVQKLWGVHQSLASQGIEYFHSYALESNKAALNAHLLFGYEKVSLSHLYTAAMD